LLALRLRSNKL